MVTSLSFVRALLLSAAFSTLLSAQPDLARLNQAVVRVESVGRENGTGFILAATPQSIRILTAAHVIADADTIRVYFYQDRAVPYRATLLPRASDALDLAVLEVTAAGANRPLPTAVPAFTIRETPLRIAETVWTVDYAWRPVSNAVASLDHDGDPQHFEYRGSGMDGFSGGPIFDETGKLAGVHHGGLGGGQFVVAVKIDAARQALNALGYALPNLGVANAAPPATPAVLTRVPIGILGSSVSFNSQYWARINSTQDRMDLASLNGSLRASIILEDIQEPPETLRARIVANLGGPAAALIEDQRVIAVRGTDLRYYRIRRGETMYLAYFHSGAAGTLQAVFYGSAAAVAEGQREIDELVAGIDLRRR